MQLDVITLVAHFLFTQLDAPGVLPVSRPLGVDTLVPIDEGIGTELPDQKIR